MPIHTHHLSFVPTGGLFLNWMTEYYLKTVDEYHDLEPTMRKMEEEGLWKMLSRETEPNIIVEHNGLFHTFRKSLKGSKK